MDLNTRYGLEFNPFIKNSADIIVSFKEYNEAVARLNYILSVKGFGLLTGTPGKGKSTAVRIWSKGLNPSLYKVVYTPLANLSDAEFYRNMATIIGLEPKSRKHENIDAIKEEIERLYSENRKTPVFIIDEADSIRSSTLSDLKVLFNFEMDSRDKVVVILVGTTKLNSMLNYSVHEAMRQRIIMNFNIEGMSKDETRQYVLDKLKGAGCIKDVFAPEALEAITNYSEGAPRMVNRICNACLNVGNAEGSQIITAETVRKAHEELILG